MSGSNNFFSPSSTSPFSSSCQSISFSTTSYQSISFSSTSSSYQPINLLLHHLLSINLFLLHILLQLLTNQSISFSPISPPPPPPSINKSISFSSSFSSTPSSYQLIKTLLHLSLPPPPSIDESVSSSFCQSISFSSTSSSYQSISFSSPFSSNYQSIHLLLLPIFLHLLLSINQSPLPPELINLLLHFFLLHPFLLSIKLSPSPLLSPLPPPIPLN